MENTVTKWLTGLTAVAVVSTIFASPYSANIFNSIFGGVAKTYSAVKN
jgi:hypothetical protein